MVAFNFAKVKIIHASSVLTFENVVPHFGGISVVENRFALDDSARSRIDVQADRVNLVERAGERQRTAVVLQQRAQRFRRAAIRQHGEHALHLVDAGGRFIHPLSRDRVHAGHSEKALDQLPVDFDVVAGVAGAA